MKDRVEQKKEKLDQELEKLERTLGYDVNLSYGELGKIHLEIEKVKFAIKILNEL
jgi:hypothetical protein